METPNAPILQHKLLLIAEKGFIDSRVQALGDYVNSEEFEALPDGTRLLFIRHLSIASRYSRVLDDRIEAS